MKLTWMANFLVLLSSSEESEIEVKSEHDDNWVLKFLSEISSESLSEESSMKLVSASSLSSSLFTSSSSDES